MKFELNNNEIKTLVHCLQQSLIDAEGYAAIGLGKSETVKNIKSVLQKISMEREPVKSLNSVIKTCEKMSKTGTRDLGLGKAVDKENER